MEGIDPTQYREFADFNSNPYEINRQRILQEPYEEDYDLDRLRRPEELYNIVRNEQQKKLDFDKELDDLRRTRAILSTKENNDAYKRYNEHIIDNQISDMRIRNMELCRQLQDRQENVRKLGLENSALEKKYYELGKEINNLENEKELEKTRSNGIAEEYKAKIENLRYERKQLEEERDKEIESLKNTILELEQGIHKVEQEKDDMENDYNKKLNDYNKLLKEYEYEIQQAENAHENLIRKTESEVKNNKIKLSEFEYRKQELANKSKDLYHQIDQLKIELGKRQDQLNDASIKYSNTKSELEAKARKLRGEKDMIENDQAELEKLHRLIDDKSYDNSDLESKINKKQEEIDNLHKDAIAWQSVTEKLKGENNTLKRIIDELDEKNKKLSDTLIGEEKKHIEESERRTFEKIRNSSSPMKIRQILNNDNEIQYTNAKRITPIMTPQESIGLSLGPEPVVTGSTEKLISVLKTNSPIRKKVAEEYLRPDVHVPPVEINKKGELYSDNNNTGPVVTSVI